MPNKLKDITDKRFARWTVIARAENTDRGQSRWLCRCDCGTEKVCMGASLRRGDTRSCGCYRDEKISNERFIHGQSHTTEHRAWVKMIQRCTDTNCSDFKNYGARGISVCKDWMTFIGFIRDMGPKPSPEMSIERRDNDGDYEPANCYWATKREQMRNNRHNHMVEYKGVRMALVCAVEAAGSVVKHSTARARLKNGWAVEAAVETPVHSKHR